MMKIFKFRIAAMKRSDYGAWPEHDSPPTREEGWGGYPEYLRLEIKHGLGGTYGYRRHRETATRRTYDTRDDGWRWSQMLQSLPGSVLNWYGVVLGAGAADVVKLGAAAGNCVIVEYAAVEPPQHHVFPLWALFALGRWNLLLKDAGAYKETTKRNGRKMLWMYIDGQEIDPLRFCQECPERVRAAFQQCSWLAAGCTGRFRTPFGDEAWWRAHAGFAAPLQCDDSAPHCDLEPFQAKTPDSMTLEPSDAARQRHEVLSGQAQQAAVTRRCAEYVCKHCLVPQVGAHCWSRGRVSRGKKGWVPPCQGPYLAEDFFTAAEENVKPAEVWTLLHVGEAVSKKLLPAETSRDRCSWNILQPLGNGKVQIVKELRRGCAEMTVNLAELKELLGPLPSSWKELLDRALHRGGLTLSREQWAQALPALRLGAWWMMNGFGLYRRITQGGRRLGPTGDVHVREEGSISISAGWNCCRISADNVKDLFGDCRMGGEHDCERMFKGPSAEYRRLCNQALWTQVAEGRKIRFDVWHKVEKERPSGRLLDHMKLQTLKLRRAEKDAEKEKK